MALNPNYKKHFPVMLPQVLEALSLEDNKVYVDATFGNGGYSEAILSDKNCKVIAIDRDETVLPRVQELKTKFGERFEFKQGKFGDFDNLIKEKVDGVVFDIGVSSMQLDQEERGFSFSKEAKLDMRMSQYGLSAKDIVNNYSEEEIADILFNYGEEKKSRQIAKKIIEARKVKEIETTTELANIIYQVIKPNFKQKINPATRSFQAIRIAVNDELGELKRGLEKASKLLLPKGKLVVVTFHSLEDRIVKTYLKENTPKTVHVSRYAKEEDKSKTNCNMTFCFASKIINPSEQEIEQNPRSRSAHMRYAVKN